jgi:hypothetical protein
MKSRSKTIFQQYTNGVREGIDRSHRVSIEIAKADLAIRRANRLYRPSSIPEWVRDLIDVLVVTAKGAARFSLNVILQIVLTIVGIFVAVAILLRIT